MPLFNKSFVTAYKYEYAHASCSEDCRKNEWKSSFRCQIFRVFDWYRNVTLLGPARPSCISAPATRVYNSFHTLSRHGTTHVARSISDHGAPDEMVHRGVARAEIFLWVDVGFHYGEGQVSFTMGGSGPHLIQRKSSVVTLTSKPRLSV